jgi:ubiquitin conjugation factor E4 B
VHAPSGTSVKQSWFGIFRSKYMVRGTKANHFRYLDPIMATLMKDPVILPISKQVIDRSTIRSHLLSDPHDPFNRSPLKIEDVIDDTALKEKIIAWRAEMMQKAKAARGDDNAMDTTDG